MTSAPNTILAIYLMDVQKFEVRGFKYLFNGIDMYSQFIYSEPIKSKTDVEVLKAFKKKYIRNLKSEPFVLTMAVNL